MLLDGRTVANDILEHLAERVHILFGTEQIIPHLAVIQVGENPETISYVAQKEKKAKEIGCVVSVYRHPENISQEELQKTIDFLCSDVLIHGIILQLPIPKELNQKTLIASISSDKDVDGFTKNSPFIVPIASAIFKLLEVPMMKETIATGDSFNEWLRSKKIVVMGKGTTGGMPIITELQKRGIKPIIIDSTTKDPASLTKSADIIITAVGLSSEALAKEGKRAVLTPEMIKKDAILLNVGMRRDENGNFVGDYNEDEIKDIASWYTPTPGGVGPVNVACLLENLVTAAENCVKN